MMIGLWSLVVLLGLGFAHAQPGNIGLRSPEGQPVEQLVVTDPGAALALAQAWQQQGRAFPEVLLRQAVTAALRQDAPWSAAEAAIRAFDLYKNRPWATDIMEPFIARQAPNVVLNPEQFAALNRQWTTQVIARTASHTPSLLLSAFPRLAAIDNHWAKALAAAVVSSTPALAFSYATELAAVDRAWAQGVLHKAAQALPYAAVRGVQAYLAEPWGPQLFAAAALRMPQWTMNMAASASAEGQAVQEALRQATDPSLRVLSQIAMSPYEREIKVRLAVFMHDIATGQWSLDEAARLSGDDRTYFRTLIAMKHAQPDSAIVEVALTDQALSLLDPINTQYEQPEAVRFRSVASMTVLGAPDIVLLTLSEFAEQAYRICRAGNLALLVDADHGYGNALNVRRTVEELETAGIAALTIEDTELPQAYGTVGSTRLIPLEEGVDKVRAALDARQDPGLVIVGRTGATAITSLEDAIERVTAYEAAGADAVFLSGVKTREQVEAICQAVRVPVMLGGSGSGPADRETLGRLGVRISLQGHQSFMAAVRATYETLKALREGTPPEELHGLAPGDVMKRFTRSVDYDRMMKNFLGGS